MIKFHSACVLFLMFCLCVYPAFGEGQNVDYQQRVDYRIKVKLDDVNHRLSGYIEFDYQHHFPENLDKIYVHLWPNAFSSKETAFAKQQLENRSTTFAFAKEEDMGYIDSLNFKAGNTELKWELDSVHPDIGIIYLNRPLRQGESITISSPFAVKIPKSFSRLGRVGQSYQITQWFPKPAVYDQRGWHPMSYLSQGEFYSSFGDFDVEITVPENYIVGASGDLQTESEIERLKILSDETERRETFDKGLGFPESSQEYKTLRFILKDAHDFAWFADKRYHVLMREAEVFGREKPVRLYAIFTDLEAGLWQSALDYMEDAIVYMSEWVGVYPYNQFTAVQGALSAGAGMEYPTITIIGESRSANALETVIVHEAIHNWFYGIFGFNERAYPWLDESFTSWYELRYFERKYDKPGLFGEAIKTSTLGKIFDLHELPLHYRNHLFYMFQCRLNRDQALNLPAVDYNYVNYGLMIYAKGPAAIDYLAHYLGHEKFDASMQAFYREWAFRHPWPEDVQHTLERETAEDLSWFFDDLIGTNGRKIYNIRKVRNKGEELEIQLRNRGELNTPLELVVSREESENEQIWLTPFERDTTIVIAGEGFKKVEIDPDLRAPFHRRINHHYETGKLFNKGKTLRLQFLLSVENPKKNHIYWMPIAAWNQYDGGMIGMAFYNRILPAKRFEFGVAPFYAIGSNDFAGTGFVRYNAEICRDCFAERLRFGVSGRRFHYYENNTKNQYNRFTPYVELLFRERNPRSNTRKYLGFYSYHVFAEFERGGFTVLPGGPLPQPAFIQETSYYFVNRLKLAWENTDVIGPYSGQVYAEQSKSFLKLGLEKRFQLTYMSRTRGLNVRMFGGFMHKLNDDIVPFSPFQMSYGTGNRFIQPDYTFDKFYLGRAERTGLLSQQVHLADGGFRTVASVGRSDTWIFAVNLDADMPFPVIKPYVDFGLFPNALNDQAGVMLSGGVSLRFFKDVFEVNLPIIETKNIVDNHEAQGRNNFPKRINFVLQLHNFHLFDDIDNLKMF